MTRIIAGSARGRRLRVPRSGTRPTSDRVRESLFATLDHEVGGLRGTRFLDLFAGSGALGLEAASRGASRVVLVERDRDAASVARANVTAVGIPGVEVVVASVGDYLERPAERFDIVVLDPPYDLPAGRIASVLQLLCAGWLADGAIVVVERPAGEADCPWPARIEALRRRTYGGTVLWYGQQVTEGEDL